MKKTLFLFALLVSSCFSVLYAEKGSEPITVEDIWGRYMYSQKSVHGINWMNDGQYYSALEQNQIVKKSVASGQKVETILDGNSLDNDIAIESYSFSSDESMILLETDIESIYRHSYKAQYFLYNRETKKIKKLSNGEKIMFATLSPDGKKVCYVKNNDLYYTTLSDLNEIRITSDGKVNNIINGWADWVYEEEFGKAVAFSWSPDSKKIGFLRFDESEVREYNMQVWGDLYPKDYRFKYPKAGEKNSEVSAYCYDLPSAKATLIEDGTDKDQYLPRVFWTNTSKEILVFKLNRLQNHLQILKKNTSTGKGKIIYEEKNNTYVEVFDDIRFLDKKDQFIMASEKDGYKHLYLYDFEGNLINQITEGKYDIHELLRLDEEGGKVYYASAEVSPMDKQLYTVNLNGKGKTRLSNGNGMHEINMSPDCKYYIDNYSSANTPAVISLYETKENKKLTVLEDNQSLVGRLNNVGISQQEFFSFKTSEKVELNGWMIKPENFDKNKKYPVLMFVYGGPGVQTVKDSWGGQNYMWFQMLAKKGYIIVSVDNRGTGSRGAEFKKSTYGQLGNLEAKDQIETAKYLRSLKYVDKERVGIWGWSFGGYMTSLCLTIGSEYFKTGIAVAPVTSWRFYDTIYTERYLGLPDDNPSGYDDNSPLTHVGKLEGNFLLVHGTGDDNVHFQNTVEMQDALIRHGKQFSSFYYPNRSHGIYERGIHDESNYKVRTNTRLHLYNMMTDFILKNL